MSESESRRLILFTRYPVPGRTKTRLIPLLGERGAASLARRLTLRTLRTAQTFRAEGNCVLEVRYDGGSERAMRHWLGEAVFLREQGPGDLGQRMARAFEDSFREGSHRTVVVGTDCPALNPQILHQAFQAMNSQPAVLGPATDGGYYLIGLRQPVPEVFVGLDWGTDRVLSDTRAILDRTGIGCAQLPPLQDVDRPADVAEWQRIAQGEDADLTRVSVVLPTLNEAERIGPVLHSVSDAQPEEIIVVDADSGDGTVEVALEAGASVIRSKPGRALQMNAGAAAARGNTLLFLHGDTSLPQGWLMPMVRALEPTGVAAGAFGFGIDRPFPGRRIIEWATNLRSRFLRAPYGDQGLFLRRAYFEELGGFADLPIMEDVEIIRRLRGYGRVITISQRVSTSGRRWQQQGFLRTTLTNRLMMLGYHSGVPLETLAAWYRKDFRSVSKADAASNTLAR